MTLALTLAAAFAQPTPDGGEVPQAEAPAPVPAAPQLPRPPRPPEIPDLPGLPDLPALPDLPEIPQIPAPPHLERLETRWLADQRVVVDEPSNDLFLMAQEVAVRAGVSDNAFVMAQNVEVESTVAGDLFVMGERIRIDEAVSGDVYAMGAEVQVTPSGSIAGNLVVTSGELRLEGPVAGDVEIDVGRFELASPIAGDLDLSAGEIAVRDGAALAGNLDYASGERSPTLEALALGEVEYTEKEVSDVEIDIELDLEEEVEEEAGLLSTVMWWSGMRGWGFFTKLLVGCVLFLIGGERIAAVGRRAASHPGESLGMGFIAACVLPVASFVALIMIVPFPLGLLGFAVLGMLLYVGQIFAAQAIGERILQRFQPDAVGSPYLSLAVGLVPLILLCAVPWFGNLAWLAATVTGIGALWAVLRGRS